MRKILLLVLLLSSAATASAQTAAEVDTLRLHKYLFRGWRFSADGGDTYESVGHAGENLVPYLEDNEAAMQHLKTYGSRRQLATFIGLPGNILVGAAVLSAAFDRWTDTTYLMVGAGVVISFVGSLLSWSANGHLEEAVVIRNRDLRAQDRKLSYELRIGRDGTGASLSLSLYW